MSIFETLHTSADLKSLSPLQLEELCTELRDTIVHTVSETGGHLSSNLGVVELTVMLHRLFDLPKDAIVWDVGHQCYTHKLLTGRLEPFARLRKRDGISGFPSPSESEYDAFVTGHSSTSVSAASGLAYAKQLAGDDGYVVAVIGDGALTGGLAYEGLCNAARHNDRLIIVLNDNQMSINRSVGFVARYLSTLRSKPSYQHFKNGFAELTAHIPLIGQWLYRHLAHAKSNLKQSLYHSSGMFEDMGLYYLGPVDGHDLGALEVALQTAKDIDRPVLLHVSTVKGKGYTPAENAPDVYHGIAGFDAESGKPKSGGMNFSKAVGDYLCNQAEKDDRLCVITAAMTDGTGLKRFANQNPDRFFDVGIAESHAVTFASGLATGNCRPVFAVYSTFLQRTYDQLLNDTSIMNNHIVLAVDRAGIVPEDGETHQGIFDVPFLTTIPNTTIYAPSTYEELHMHLNKALYDETGIVAVRYPRGEQFPLNGYKPDGKDFTYFRNSAARTLVITYGRLFANVLKTVKALQGQGEVSVLKLNRIHPIPPKALEIAMRYQLVLFFEESAERGGLAEQFGAQLLQKRFYGKYESYAIDHALSACTVEEGLKQCGLDVDGMIKRIVGDGQL